MSHIIPVPKRFPVTVMNDLRPIAMTSTVMKIFERIVLNIIVPEVAEFIDPLQFAYRKNRGVDDALLYLLNRLLSHLDKPSTSIRLMFYDFSSAFNTIQPHVLSQKLCNMKLSPPIIMWIFDYLTNRPQAVKLSNMITSQTIFTNCGCPQGTVLSPFLFSLYTSDFRPISDSIFMIKYADDSIQASLSSNDDHNNYFNEIRNFVQYCDRNYLELNVSKTKEMIIDFRKNTQQTQPIIIKEQEIEQVKTYKYLGITLNNTLTWNDNTNSILKKVNPRLYCLRKLNSFNVSPYLLQLFYSSSILSILSFGIVSWGSCISRVDKTRLDRVIRKAGRVIGSEQDDIDTLTDNRIGKKITKIQNDATHPLFSDFDRAYSDRSGRYRLPRMRTDRYRNSFVPDSLKKLNSNFNR